MYRRTASKQQLKHFVCWLQSASVIFYSDQSCTIWFLCISMLAVVADPL